MINKTYAVLMSGVQLNPAKDVTRYRPYITYQGAPIPSDSDEDSRMRYAEYILKLAKISPLYPQVLMVDPENTYNIEFCVGDMQADVIKFPSRKDIMGLSQYLPKELRDSADMSSVYDRAALFCIAICNRLDKNA